MLLCLRKMAASPGDVFTVNSKFCLMVTSSNMIFQWKATLMQGDPNITWCEIANIIKLYDILSQHEFSQGVILLRKRMQGYERIRLSLHLIVVQYKGLWCPPTKISLSNPGSIPYQPRDRKKQSNISHKPRMLHSIHMRNSGVQWLAIWFLELSRLKS